MRGVIRAAIIGDTALATLGVLPELVLAGDIDTPSGTPFLNLKWGARTPGIGDQKSVVLVIWVHDEPNDYERIDAICARLAVLLPAIEGEPDTTYGGWVNQVRWLGDSLDLKDEGHNTIVKQCTFSIIGST